MAASSKEALMLKDYLLDDISSCSSNGFRSFPRRRRCSTVRFLLEIDLKERDSAGFSPENPLLRRSRSKRAALTSFSAFLRVSEAVFIAVKKLSFASGKSSCSSSSQIRHRNHSLKLPSKSFCKKSHSIIHGEDEKSLDINPLTSINASSIALISNMASTKSKSKAENWVVSPRTKKWSSEKEKEQLSPVSVLDFPFQDEEETSSPSQRCFQGAKKQLMQKIRRSEDLAQLEPLDLEQPFVISELEEEAELFTQPSIINEEDHKAVELLNLIQPKSWSNRCASTSENLLLDFFRERIEKNTSNQSEFEETLEVAEDWLNGSKEELWREWEVEEGREAYGREMEKGGRWRKMEEEKEEEGLAMEDEVWSGLLYEVLVDLL